MRVLRLLALLLLLGVHLGEAANHRSLVVEEFVGPFPSWKNVKTDYFAAGNGVGCGGTDDTTAIQNGIDALNDTTSTVLYFPPGTYKITSTLTVLSKRHIALLGAHPDTTILKWCGSAGGTLLHVNSSAYSKFDRFTFDGNAAAPAGVLVEQGWAGGSTPHFDSGNEYADNIFQDAAYGIRGGNSTQGFAETTVTRCDFLNLTTAAVILKNGNALDLWVWYSYFSGPGAGITNTPGAGAWRAYKNIFENMGGWSLQQANTEVFSARWNTFANSAAYQSQTLGTPNAMVFHGNTILDYGFRAILQGNHGPMILIDNVYRVGASEVAPSYESTDSTGDSLLVGNTFSIASPVNVHGGRLLEVDTTVVSRTSPQMAALTVPALPMFTATQSRTPCEANSAATIASCITTQQALNGQRPVVHIAAGTYTITSTLTIPAGSDVQLVGDGYSTVLQGNGTVDPVLALPGPSKATIRDLMIHANGKRGIVGTNLNQPGGRVYLYVPELRFGTVASLWAQTLSHTVVDMENFGALYVASGVGILADNATIRATAGLGLSNTIGATTYAVANGGSLLVQDTWYEPGGTNNPNIVDLTNRTGTFTLDSARLATLTLNQALAAVQVSGFSGRATFLGGYVNDRYVMTGDGTATVAALLGNYAWDQTGGPVPDAFLNTTSPPGDVRFLGNRQIPSSDSGSNQITNVGGTDDAGFVRAALAQMRGFMPQLPSTTNPGVTNPGVTDLRLFHTYVHSGTTNIFLQGDPVTTVPLVLRLVR